MDNLYHIRLVLLFLVFFLQGKLWTKLILLIHRQNSHIQNMFVISLLYLTYHTIFEQLFLYFIDGQKDSTWNLSYYLTLDFLFIFVHVYTKTLLPYCKVDSIKFIQHIFLCLVFILILFNHGNTQTAQVQVLGQKARCFIFGLWWQTGQSIMLTTTAFSYRKVHEILA